MGDGLIFRREQVTGWKLRHVGWTRWSRSGSPRDDCDDVGRSGVKESSVLGTRSEI